MCSSDLSFTFETIMDFDPQSFKQLAGIVLLYDMDNWVYMHLSMNERNRRCISVYQAENKHYTCLYDEVTVPDKGIIHMRADVRDCVAELQYRISDNGMTRQKEGAAAAWTTAVEGLDVSFLSDEACMDGWFSGAVYGICCEDLTGSGAFADFRDIRFKAPN